MRIRRWNDVLLISVGSRLAVLHVTKHKPCTFLCDVHTSLLNIEKLGKPALMVHSAHNGLREQEEFSYVPTFDILDMCMLSKNLLIICDDMKRLTLFERVSAPEITQGEWRYKACLLLPKRCYTLLPIPNGENDSFLAGDKVGDVWTFTVNMFQTELNGACASLSESTDCASCSEYGRIKPHDVGTFMLGVNCTLLDMAFCAGIENPTSLLAVSDRDEKVRLCSYPETYIIENIVMEHTAFVTSIAYVPTLETLFSASGDGTCVAVSLSNDSSRFKRIGRIESRKALMHTKQIRLEDGSLVGPNILGIAVNDAGTLLALFHQQCAEVDIYRTSRKADGHLLDVQLFSTIDIGHDVADICFCLSDDAECCLVCLSSSVLSTSATSQAESDVVAGDRQPTPVAAEKTNITSPLCILHAYKISVPAGHDDEFIPSVAKIPESAWPSDAIRFLTEDPAWLEKPHRKSNLYGARTIGATEDGDVEMLHADEEQKTSADVSEAEGETKILGASRKLDRSKIKNDSNVNRGIKLKNIGTGGVKRRRQLADS